MMNGERYRFNLYRNLVFRWCTFRVYSELKNMRGFVPVRSAEKGRTLGLGVLGCKTLTYNKEVFRI